MRQKTSLSCQESLGTVVDELATLVSEAQISEIYCLQCVREPLIFHQGSKLFFVPNFARQWFFDAAL